MKNNKLGLICIDWDGTLLSSDDVISNCIQKTLIHMKLPMPSQNDLTKIVGESEENIIQACLQNNMHLSDSFWPIFRSIYSEKTLELASGAAEFLLRHQHFNIAIVSNKNSEILTTELQHFNLMPWIDLVYAANCYVPKPSPHMIQQAMTDTGSLVEHTWMIGDSKADAHAAEQANVTYIPVNAGHWRKDFFSLNDIDLAIDMA